MAWVYLMGAGLLEVVWATSLKHADGLTRLGPSLLAFASAGVSFFLLSMALRVLPAGTGYAAFVGIGAVGVALYGWIVAGEPVSALRVASIGLIVLGVVGLRVSDAS